MSGPVEGTLRRLVYRNPETHWTVLRLEVEGRPDPVTAVGRLPELRPGDRLRLHGRWQTDRRFGRQFVVDTCLPVAPDTREGLRRYLGSGRIPGVGPVLADRIVRRFGDAALEVIETEPDRLREVEGIGRSRAEGIRQVLGRERAFHRTMIFLQGHGVPAHLADRIHRRYGTETEAVLDSDPYRLCLEIAGIGFRTADRIGMSLGVVLSDPRRLRAGILSLLARGLEAGHVFLPLDRLIRLAAGLGVGPEDCQEAVEDLERRGLVRIETRGDLRAVYHPELHRAEQETADRLREILGASTPALPADPNLAEEAAVPHGEVEFGAEQRGAIREALSRRVLVITGGPGTGKTTLIRAILGRLEQRGARIELCAPTGRAARRIREATGREARTIHRLLEYQPRLRGFLRDRENPIDAEAVIVDETSMVDLPLAHRLLEAFPPGCRLVLVGDADQLPPVGPGQPLADLIASGAVPVVRLTEVYRQARESLIVRNAHRVLRGEMPEWNREGDFYFAERDDPAEIVAEVKSLVGERLPRRFGLDPVTDIQVLSPMHRGPVGVTVLNEELQALLNPSSRRAADVPPLRIGDKVMQVRNDYEREVFNGDIGRVVASEEGGEEVRVRFEERTVAYGRDDLSDLTLAYATTIHKAQGSEYPAVVVVLHPQHAILLERNLIYTAITRARRLVVLAGSRRALAMAVRNRRTRNRFSGLAERLRGGPP